jgi:imidazolonepropionase-like amidohydrolase
MTRLRTALTLGAGLLFTAIAFAQAPATTPRDRAPEPWRFAGTRPCVNPEGSVLKCPSAGRFAIRAGRLFDSVSGRMLSKQVVLVADQKITEVGPEGQITIPGGTPIIDLSRSTVLPGLIDAHSHIFNTRRRTWTPERALLMAIQNAQDDLRAGFTAMRDMGSHSNGYADVEVRDAINMGDVDGPRLQVSGRSIVWAPKPADPSAPANPLASIAIRSVEEARAAIREHVDRKVDWIKLHPTGGYAFTASGEAQYALTYPLPVLQALIDEAHRLGKKAACHAFGGEGLQNAIAAGCDTIEHGYGLTQGLLDTMTAQRLAFDPTLTRYTEPYMDDNDAKSTGGKFRMIPIFEKAVSMAVATTGLRVMVGSGVDGSTFPHGTQALELESLVKRTKMPAVRAIQAATMVNAEVMGWQNEIGSIAKGKFADVIAVAGDPAADITELQRVKFVMKGGKIVVSEISN